MPSQKSRIIHSSTCYINIVSPTVTPLYLWWKCNTSQEPQEMHEPEPCFFLFVIKCHLVESTSVSLSYTRQNNYISILCIFINNVNIFSYHVWCLFQDYDEEDLMECKDILLEKCDLNHDGKINKKELAMVLMSYNRQSTTDEPDTST